MCLYGIAPAVVMGDDVVRADLAATGGVHTSADAVKAIMCGAQVVQVVSVLLKDGVSQLRHLRDAFTA